MHYKGSCHCGKVTYEVEGEIESVIDCNCSMCQRRGGLLWFVPRDKFRLTSPEGNASEYMFNNHVIHHRFCSTCGIQPYAVGMGPGNRPMAAINVRCLEGVEPESFKVVHYDGRSR